MRATTGESSTSKFGHGSNSDQKLRGRETFVLGIKLKL